MKKIIIAFVAVVMTAIASTAQADARISATTRYVMDTTPAVNVAQAQRCAAAYHHGGTYRWMSDKITLTCTKHQIHKEWDPSKN